MTRACSSRLALGRSFLLGLACAACSDESARAPDRAKPAAPEDSRPFTPWHPRERPLPFPQQEWYWQVLLAQAPQPESLPQDVAAAERLQAALERVAQLADLQSEEELPAMVEDARRDPAPIFAALDDPRREVRYAAARVMLRLMSGPSLPFPQQLVQAAALHLRDVDRDPADEVSLVLLETIARSGFRWTSPILLKTFGKVDLHKSTVVRIRAAAKLALAGCYGGMDLLLKALKENTPIQDDVNREWTASFQTAWWKEEAMVAIAAVAGSDFGHSPDASDADQVASVRRIEQWWRENKVRKWSESPALDDPVLVERVKLMILGFGTFQIRNVDNSAFILQGLGPKVAPLLFEALAGSSFMIRRHVLGVLTGLVDDVPEAERVKWIERVQPSLSDRDSAIRVRALEIIGASRIPEALPHLERALAQGDDALAETAMRQLAAQGTPAARSVLERAAVRLPPDDLLAVPLAAARLAAGDLEPLEEYLQRLGRDSGPEPRAQMYLSWIVDSDGLAETTNPEARKQVIARIEQEIRARAEATTGSSR